MLESTIPQFFKIWKFKRGWICLECGRLRPFHTRDWEPMTNTLQALAFVEKAEPVQVCFTLRLRDQHSMWMQDGCKVYMALNGSCFIVTWTIFKNYLWEVGLTTKPGDHVTLNSNYHVWGPAWIEMHWNSIWLKARSHIATLEGPWPHYMILEVC
jgi:hypothetical protein